MRLLYLITALAVVAMTAALVWFYHQPPQGIS